jgi:hypothetical protein
MTATPLIEITLLAKHDGPLTKQISLARDGSVKSDGSTCIMARGTARRVSIGNVCELAEFSERMHSSEALALGTLRQDLPDRVEIVTKRALDELNGAARPDIIAHRERHYLPPRRGGVCAVRLRRERYAGRRVCQAQ